MINLTYTFRSGLEARGFATKIRTERRSFHSKELRYPNTTIFRKGRVVSISHDESKNPQFFEKYSSDYQRRISFTDEITAVAKKYHGYYMNTYTFHGPIER